MKICLLVVMMFKLNLNMGNLFHKDSYKGFLRNVKKLLI